MIIKNAKLANSQIFRTPLNCLNSFSFQVASNSLNTNVDGNQSHTKCSARSLHSNSDNESYINWPGLNHSTNENQTYAGYLKKQGHYFKQWKERYFVLDSIKHQVDIFWLFSLICKSFLNY